MPKKEPLVVDDPVGAFQKFEDLTRRLLAVSREELKKKLKIYGKKSAKARRKHDPGRENS